MNLVGTTDGDADGLLSDKAVKNHSLGITFMAWMASEVGKGSGDTLMETSERLDC